MAKLKIEVLVGLVNRISAPLNQIKGQLTGLQRFGRGLGAIGRSVRRLSLYAGLPGGIGAGVAAKSMLDAAVAAERYNTQLAAIEGSAEKAKAAMAFVDQFAVDTPLALDGAMEAFVRMRAFGLDPMSGQLQSLVDVSSKLGGGQERLEGIVLAVGQAWAKQKLQGEEILQLVERGVPVWDLLAKQTGKSTAELQEMSRKGQLTRDVIAGLIDEMGKWSSGAAKAEMRNWGGLIANIGDMWTRFGRMVMDSGPFDALKSRVENLLATINRMSASGDLAKYAEEIGAKMVSAIETVEKLASAFGTVAGWIGTAAEKFVWFGEMVGTGAAMWEQQITERINEIKLALMFLPDLLRQIGSDMIDGLLAGLKSKWEAVKAWFAGLADNIPGWIKSPLGIESPSRVFMGLGQNIMRGLEVGLAARSAYPQRILSGMAGNLTAASRVLAPAAGAAMLAGTGATVSAMPVLSGGGGGANVSMPITINVQAPAGADPRQIADMVRREVTSATNQASGRIASLYDRGDGM